MSELNLDLPKREDPNPSSKGGSPILLGLIIVLLIACVVGIWMPKQEQGPEDLSEPKPKVVREYDENLVLKLKKAGAYLEAADLIESAIHHPKISGERKARLYKKQADFYRLAKKRGQALLAYYQAEKHITNRDSDLAREVSQAIIEVLRKSGHYSAVSSELAAKNREKRGEKSGVSDPKVAKIDGVELRMSDFETHLETHIDQKIRQLTHKTEDPKEVQRITDQIRKQYSAPYEKLQYLQQWVQEELLLREAEQWQIEKHPEYEKNLEAFRKNLMRSLLIQTKLKVEISESDLKNYAQVNRGALGLSTDAGALSDADFEKVRAEAASKYRAEKVEELTREFQASVMKRHEVEIYREAFSEAAR